MNTDNKTVQINGNFIESSLDESADTLLMIPVGRLDFSNHPLRMIELMLCGEKWREQHEERLRIWETARQSQNFGVSSSAGT